jgi:hypothetical protein
MIKVIYNPGVLKANVQIDGRPARPGANMITEKQLKAAGFQNWLKKGVFTIPAEVVEEKVEEVKPRRKRRTTKKVAPKVEESPVEAKEDVKEAE